MRYVRRRRCATRVTVNRWDCTCTHVFKADRTLREYWDPNTVTTAYTDAGLAEFAPCDEMYDRPISSFLHGLANETAEVWYPLRGLLYGYPLESTLDVVMRHKDCVALHRRGQVTDCYCCCDS